MRSSFVTACSVFAVTLGLGLSTPAMARTYHDHQHDGWRYDRIESGHHYRPHRGICYKRYRPHRYRCCHDRHYRRSYYLDGDGYDRVVTRILVY